MDAREFLLNECANLNTVLEETLRYEYGVEGSRIFFEECLNRLELIEQLINAASPTSSTALSEYFYKLEELSSLISRIERSSLKEYSWPFLEEFKEISLSACTDPNTTQVDENGNPYPPQVHVLAEGGLSSYLIHVDGRRIPSKRRILTIFFPRTLKHYVLLHPILGHEMGHAIFSIAAYEGLLDKVVEEYLIQKSRFFTSESSIAEWLYTTSVTPKSVSIFLSVIEAELEIDQSNVMTDYIDFVAWKEEFLCDFIGLLMFGPSFLAAQCDLLYSIDSTGSEIGNYHPPTACRVNTMIAAAQILGYDTLKFDTDIQIAVDAFWKSILEKKQLDSWFDVFTNDQIQTTLTKLSAFLSTHKKALYPQPTTERIQPLIKQVLKKIPPVGYEFKLKTVDGELTPDLAFDYSVDFRDILFAGWIAASAGDPSLNFEDANKLCEYGILQQRAIKMMNAEVNKGAV